MVDVLELTPKEIIARTAISVASGFTASRALSTILPQEGNAVLQALQFVGSACITHSVGETVADKLMGEYRMVREGLRGTKFSVNIK